MSLYDPCERPEGPIFSQIWMLAPPKGLKCPSFQRPHPPPPQATVLKDRLRVRPQSVSLRSLTASIGGSATALLLNCAPFLARPSRSWTLAPLRPALTESCQRWQGSGRHGRMQQLGAVGRTPHCHPENCTSPTHTDSPPLCISYALKRDGEAPAHKRQCSELPRGRWGKCEGKAVLTLPQPLSFGRHVCVCVCACARTRAQQQKGPQEPSP